MSENKWAAIVYGRTYEVDFRFLTVPDDFNDERVNWASKYINSTTRYPQNLPQHPCWSFFQDDKHCVVGLTCMVKNLLENSPEENSKNLTKDMYGRNLFVFLGYVANIPHSPIPSMKLELFKELYESYVRPRWNDKSYEVRNLEKEGKNSARYDKSFDLDVCTQEPENIPSYSFNRNNERRFIWSVNANQNLWYKASQESKSLSICLGLFRKKYFLDGEFLNGTALDITGNDKYINPEKLHKEKEVQCTVIQQPEKRQADRVDKVTFSDKSGTFSQAKDKMRQVDNPNLHPSTPSRRNPVISQENNKKSVNTRDLQTEDPEFYRIQLNYGKGIVKELSQFVQEGKKREEETFNKVKKEAEETIQGLKSQISQYSGNDSLSKHLNEELTKIVKDFEEVIRAFADLCGLRNQSQVSSDKNLNQEEKHPAKIESKNIDFDFGFKEKSDKNESKQKKWF
ncbi:hypothetical protein NIES22_65620 [Calothrix brevissima NIES-22]|nr:hypothetical protein NIES22_65620 [Calothrix brevissima NIES-22]